MIFVAVLVAVAACTPPDDNSAQSSNGETTSTTQSTQNAGDLAIRTELSGEPALGDAEVRVYILDGMAAVEDANVSVTGDMTHAGMVPVIAEAPQQEQGLYVTDGFEFTMAGDWIITTEVTLPDGSEYQDELTVSVPGQ